MTRLKQAWLALCGKLEPEVRIERVPVVGEASLAKAYVVYVPDKGGAAMRTAEGGILWYKRDPRYFATCEQAHREHPDESVHMVSVVKVGNACFVAKDLKPIEFQPKPKIAKGKRTK
jgi:hypothetical protein